MDRIFSRRFMAKKEGSKLTVWTKKTTSVRYYFIISLRLIRCEERKQVEV